VVLVVLVTMVLVMTVLVMIVVPAGGGQLLPRLGQLALGLPLALRLASWHRHRRPVGVQRLAAVGAG
jgi:hypothetical protein